MAIAPFPHHYEVTLTGGQLTAGPRAPILAGAPPQFGGQDDVWSPEELLVSAALLCLQTTFEAFARRASLPIPAWRGTAVGTLDKGRGGPVFSSIALAVELETAPGDEDRTRELLTTAEQHCLITRALQVPVTVTVAVRARAGEERAAG